MAQGEKYNVHAKSPFGDNRIFKIYEEGYSGAVTDVKGTNKPIGQKWPGSDTDIYEPIMGTEIHVNIVAQTADQYIEFASATNKQYLGVLYNSTQAKIEWQGWYVPEEMEQNESTLPQTVNLTFACGLGYLQQIDYLNAGAYYTGREREIVILAQALEEITAGSPNNLNIRTMLNLHPTGASTAYAYDALYYSYIDQNKYINDDGTVWNCLDVIRDIIKSYGCRIIMGELGWWIVRIRAFALLQDGKDVYYTVYTSTGVYSGRSALASSQILKTVTGPNDVSRSEDIAWTGRSKRSRFERAVKEVSVVFDHGYRSMINNGNFNEQWASFWTVDDGTVSLVQDTENKDIYNLFIAEETGTDLGKVSQTITNMRVESNNQTMAFSAECMVQAEDSVTAFNIYIKIYIDADSGVGDDRTIVNSLGYPSWGSSASFLTYTFNTTPGEWHKIDIVIPYIRFTGDMYVQLWNGNCTGGTADGFRWRNINLFGTYDTVTPEKTTELNTVISTNNLIQSTDIVVQSGDVDVGGNEWNFFKNAKTRDDSALLTTTWRSFYPSGGVKVLYGPTQSLVEYARDNQIVQYGTNRRRLQGTLTFNWSRLAYGIIKDGTIYYVPTSLDYDYMSCQLRVSMLELPSIDDEVLPTNLVTGWINDVGTPWATFTVTSAPTIDALEEGAGGDGICYSNSISILIPYESFRVQISGTFDTEAPILIIRLINITMVDGYDEIITPSATAGASTIYIEQQSPTGDVSHSDILVKITRIYGF